MTFEQIKRSLSSPRLARAKFVRRNTAHFESPTREWLELVEIEWTRGAQPSKLDHTLKLLHRLPCHRTPSLQLQVGAVCIALQPHVSPSMADELIRILLADANLVQQPSAIWSSRLVAQLPRLYSLEELLPLAQKWAREQTTDTCLREDCPLVWLMRQLVPSARARSTALGFLKTCCRRWQAIPDETMSFLREIQQALPLQTIDECPMVLYFCLFRCWLCGWPQHQSLLYSLQQDDIRLLIAEAARRLQ